MLIFVAAAAAAAAHPATAPANAQHQEHQKPMMQMAQAGEHKSMDCCKDGCKDMAKKHDGEGAAHAEHKDR
jgi:ABC-type uncharacterized transport system substrate-binding protein